MAIHGISHASQSFASSSSSASTSKADESLEQLAADGDPTAIAELKQEKEQGTPQPNTGPTEPGKGAQVDRYV